VFSLFKPYEDRASLSSLVCEPAMTGLTVQCMKTINQSKLSLAGMPSVYGFTHSEFIPDTCVLCLDDLDETLSYRRLPCTHLFHLGCIDEWLTTRDASCPVCRIAFYDLIPEPPPSSGTSTPTSRNRRPDNRRRSTPLASLKAWCRKKIP